MPKNTEIVSISLNKKTLRKGKQMAKERGFQYSFSALVAHLINCDAERLEAEKASRTNGNTEVPA
jgi:hypothetical protein